jgi:site-specific DNA recombinase
MKRAAAYPRVSSDDQRHNYSIPTQLAAIASYAEGKGYVLVGDRYADPVTGGDVEPGDGAVPAFVEDYTSRELSRPALDAALVYLEAVGFDVLIVYCLDRLARDPYMRKTLEIMLEERGARVEYVLGNYDETPEGEVRKDLDATFGKWENARRVERSERGKRGKAERGLFVCGPPPFGYRIDRSAPGGLAIDEEEAAIVRRIFRLYVDERMSITGTADTLNEQGVSSRSGKWARSTVRAILHNTAYVGRIYYNKHKRLSKTRMVKRPREEWVEIEITPIVDRAVFNQAQQRLEHNRRFRRRAPKRFYLLSGMVFCSECGRPYVGQTMKTGHDSYARYYRHRKQKGHCCNRYIPASELAPAVWDAVVGALLDPARLLRGHEAKLARQEEEQIEKRAYLEELRRRLEKSERKKHKLTEAYIDPDVRMTREEYVAQREKADEEAGNSGREMRELERELAQPAPPALPEMETFFASVREALGDEMSPEAKKKLLQQLNARILIDPDRNVELEIGGLSAKASRCYWGRTDPADIVYSHPVPRRPTPTTGWSGPGHS